MVKSRLSLLIQEKFNRNIENILKETKKKYKKDKEITNQLKKPTFLLGVSGGPDSVAMLYLFYNLSLIKNISLKVGHFNHMVRGEESFRDENFVKEICRKFNIEIFIGKIKKKTPKINEEFLRKERLKFFLNLSKKNVPCFIAFAHTKYDNLETIFMNLLQGKFLKSHLGIRIWLPIFSKCLLIHPLLNIGKHEILQFIMDNNLPYVIDSSNLKSDFFRNYIRHKIFPAFKTYKNSFFDSLEYIENKIYK